MMNEQEICKCDVAIRFFEELIEMLGAGNAVCVYQFAIEAVREKRDRLQAVKSAVVELGVE